MSEKIHTCYLLGGKSLLIQCAKHLQDNSFDIRAIVTEDYAIKAWADSKKIPTFTRFEYDRLVTLGKVDYVFSITHLNIISDNILSLASKKAINFHDGVLPGYAGLNVTTWAIINQEKTHGVTWHEMTGDIDKGDVLKQVEFDLDAEETSFTLNAKCYEAALNSFYELVSEINNSSLVGKPQNFETTLYSKYQRPDSMSVLDWSRSATELGSLIRALNFGPYSNPISTPKMLIGENVYYVKEVKIAAGQSEKCGTILSIEKQMTVQTENSSLQLTHLLNEKNEKIDVEQIVAQNELKIGDVLSFLDGDTAKKLTELEQKFARSEAKWLKTLNSVEQISIPFKHQVSGNAGRAHYKSVEQSTEFLKSGFDIKSLLVLYVSKLSQKEKFSIYFQKKSQQSMLELFVENCPPIEFDLDYSSTAEQLIEQCRSVLHKVEDDTYCKDLMLREPSLFASAFRKHLIVSESNLVSADDSFDLKIRVDHENNQLEWIYNEREFSEKNIARLQSLFVTFTENMLFDTQQKLSRISLLSENENKRVTKDWNNTLNEFDNSICVHQLFEKQVLKTPKSIALSFGEEILTYEELNRRSNQIANYLISKNIKSDQLVGLLMERSVEMIVAMMGILKSGAAYLPLDPTYPSDRISYMLNDAEVSAVVTQTEHSNYVEQCHVPILVLDDDQSFMNQFDGENAGVNVNSSNLAYTIYTSGSTGKPKGVMVEHRNVINFFEGMSKDINYQNGVWLAVTSISFDISVLEIFWTLANGFEIALFADSERKSSKKIKTVYPDIDMQFSLFYWNVAEDEKDYDDDVYRLLMESVKYGDENDFTAVYTPERHFQAFGGLFPNPSITSAAIASVTKNIKIRAGSCVAPLHHPVRLTEDWSIVDNLSHGRVGMAFAAGWQPNDFVIMPDNHADAKNIMFETLDTVKKLWRGETLEFPGPKGEPIQVRTLPRPVQKELPVWITTAGNPEMFKKAGELGANILTHLLGQSVDVVAKNIKVYREAYKQANHEGDGHITLLLHTLVGPDDDHAKELARAPMKKYLKSAMFLVKAAAWNFPTFKTLSEDSGKTLDEFFETISDEDMDGVLEFAFERYYSTSGLFGSVERCLKMVDQLKQIGVNEIGCLIDYGLDTDNVLKHLPYLNDLRKVGIKQTEDNEQKQNDLSVADIIQTRNVTHLQCTPSMANMLVAEKESSEQIKTLSHMMVGGEAFPTNLANSLSDLVKGRVTNMYGPTETTIWSTTQDISAKMSNIPIGKPIINTQIYILDKYLMPLPVGVVGDLYIAGDGVVRGYHKQPELTDERFINNPFAQSQRMYCTGDLAKYSEDGTIEYLGRNDQQIKIRGYRIELGEIEALILNHESVKEVAVILREDTKNDKRIVAYVKTEPGSELEQKSIKALLSDDLPEFMIPSIFVKIGAMPLTPNGKVDRNAFPIPEHGSVQRKSIAFVKATNKIQEEIVTIWQQVLGVDNIGLEDNFFDIGGHSLIAIETLSKLKKITDKPLRMTDMFRFPTIHQFSNYLSSENEENKKMVDSQERASTRKSARKSAMERRKRLKNARK